MDALFMEQVRRGDPDATHRFFREYYPSIYRYLLWLTERRETAEDLAQETLVRAWRHLDRFEGRAPVRVWLLRIAHREFLRHLESKRVQASLEAMAEVQDTRTAELADAVELREVIRKLPVEEGEVVVLHYLQGYDCQEIADIIRAPVSTVKYRLSAARAHLQRELGEGDLIYLNEPAAPMRQWAWLPLDEMHALEARLSTRAAKDRAAPGQGAPTEATMERRAFLRHAAAGAVGMMLPEAEREIVDDRLTRKVTLALKATALADLCTHLSTETGIQIAAGASVADEKVTLFCKKLPLRDVMRQLSRPFGYTWLRSGTAGEYKYELVQDLRSQLLEEELRNRDRNEALIALDREIARYRPYLGLTPDEALARSKTAPSEEKKLLEKLAWGGWGPIQMYYRLSAQEMAAIRAGEQLSFAQEPRPGERRLPSEIARGVLQAFRTWPLIQGKDGWELTLDATKPGATPVPVVPDSRARLVMTIRQSELGRMALNGSIYWYTVASDGRFHDGGGTADNYVDAISPTVAKPDNALANTKLAQVAALRPRVSISPPASCHLTPSTTDPYATVGTTPEPRVTTADVLEAVHQATGLPIVSDYYTRLYQPEAVSAQNQPLFDALNGLADRVRMRWRWDGSWLQFRSTSYYDDRIKEVPNRLLARWAASRRQHGTLTIDDLCEIAQLPDAQLDAGDMAEGARACFGLQEWELGRSGNLRRHLRFLAGFTPAQRQETLGPSGLLFTRMPLAQQQQFVALALESQSHRPLQSLEELDGATLCVEYTQPGAFQWGAASHPGHGYASRWVVPLEPATRGRRVFRPMVVGRTREEVLQAVRRTDPKLREALLQARRREDPRLEAAPHVIEEDQISPTRLELAFVYVPCASNARAIHLQTSYADYNLGWPQKEDSP